VSDQSEVPRSERKHVSASHDSPAWAMVAELGRARLVVPPLGATPPDEIAAVGDRWHWGTRPLDRMKLYLFDVKMVAHEIAAHGPMFSLSHGGHGINSYALTLVSTAPSGDVAIFTQGGLWGGYSDEERDLARINATYQEIAAAWAELADGRRSDRVRWLAFASELRGERGIIDLDALRAGADEPVERFDALVPIERVLEAVRERRAQSVATARSSLRAAVPQLAEALRTLADDAHLVINVRGSNRYVQLATFRPNLRAETIGQRFLAQDGEGMSVDQLVWLAERGWHDADDGGNLWREWIPADEDEAAAAAIEVLITIHGVTELEEVWFQSSDDGALQALEGATAAPAPSAAEDSTPLTPATRFAMEHDTEADDLPLLSDPDLLQRLQPVAVVDYVSHDSVLELLAFADDRVFRRHAGRWVEDPAWRDVLPDAPARSIAVLDRETLARVERQVDQATFDQPWVPFAADDVSMYWPSHRPESDGVFDWSAFADEISFGDRRSVAEEPAASTSEQIDLRTAPQTVPLGELIPALGTLSGAIPPHLVPTSCQSALLSNAPTWERLAASTIGDVLRWRGVGPGRADHILRFALRSGELAVAPSADDDRGDAQRSRADKALRLVAAWAVHQGVRTGLGDALQAARRPGTPRSVVAAADILETIELSAIALPPEERSFDAHQSALDLLASFEGREAVILERVLADGLRPVPTLEEIGRELGVTRERVRQIQVKVAERLDALLQTETYDVLVARAELLAAQIGAACPVDHLPRELQPGSALTDELFAYLAGPYRMVDGWLLRRDRGTSPAEVAIDAFDAVTDEDGVVAADALFDALSSMGVAPRWHLPLLETADGIRPLDGHFVRWGSNVQRLTAVLAIAGRPMTNTELVERVLAADPEVNPRTLTNTLARDEFRRVGRGRYALAKWDGEDYRGIVAEMADMLVDGPRPIAELAADLVERFGVSATSVSMYATMHPRFIAAEGEVRLRRDDEPYEITATLEDTARCYQIDGAWAWRVPVDHDLLRGSGRPVPEAFAAHLGARPTHPITLRSGDQEIKVGWGMYPAIGSLRRRAEELELVQGDWMFVRHSSSAGLSFLPLPSWRLQAATPEERARLLVGSTEDDPRDLATCLADALGIAATEAHLPDVVRVLEARGETDILTALEGAA